MSHRVVVHDYFSPLKETTHDHSRTCHKKEEGDKSVKSGKKLPEFSKEENLRPSVSQSDSPSLL